MRLTRTFTDEAEARRIAALLDTQARVTEIAVYERPTLYAMGKVFEEGCWAVSWLEYSL